MQLLSPTKNERIEKVKLFREACLKANFQEIGPHVFELKGNFSKTLTLCTLVHGNEIGGIEIFLKLLEGIQNNKLSIKSNIRLMLGNVDAYYEDKRFLESDLNRSFKIESGHTTREELRALELEKYLHDTDVLIDIHQTIGPTSTAFFIFEFEQTSYNLARVLKKDLPVVISANKRAFKGVTTTSYIIGRKGIAITIETGQKSIDDTQISMGLQISRQAIEMDFTKTIPTSEIENSFVSSQTILNPDGSLELVKKYNNFDSVKMGELLAKNTEKEVHCEFDGKILFPKYGEYARSSAELAQILKPFKL
ncbi:MAG: succinylglutamate desuccinylase/aspartoacylase family protein [Bdellovibrionota bacterium]